MNILLLKYLLHRQIIDAWHFILSKTTWASFVTSEECLFDMTNLALLLKDHRFFDLDLKLGDWEISFILNRFKIFFNCIKTRLFIKIKINYANGKEKSKEFNFGIEVIVSE